MRATWRPRRRRAILVAGVGALFIIGAILTLATLRGPAPATEVGQGLGDDEVDPKRPIATILLPVEGSLAAPGDAAGHAEAFVDLLGRGFSADGAALDDDALTWMASRQGAAPIMLGEGAFVAGARLPAPPACGASYDYTVSLTVRDGRGLAGTDTRLVSVQHVCP